nr:hypothetical protein BaRGS_018050 [Batillaria attramentaria]
MGYAGAYNSGNSIAASETLNDIGRTFVQVSGVSTSPALKDRTRFPYFMRIVPPDDTQARVLMEILAKLGISYIQVIYDSTTTYAVGLYNAIVDELKTGRYDVCIAQAIPVKPQNEASLYTWVLDKLRSKSSAKMVIIIQHIPEILKVMEATLPVLSSSDGLTSEQLVEAMKNVRLDLYSTNRLVNIFDSNGDGVVGYKVLQVKRDLTSSSGGLTYGDVLMEILAKLGFSY